MDTQMARATVKNRCVICSKEKASFKCEGCSQTFCYNHVTDHRQELNKQLDEIEVLRDLFRQTLTEKNIDPQKHPLIEEINRWEQESMEKIRQTAKEAKELIFKHHNEHTNKIEIKLTTLTDHLRVNRQENDFVETDLNQWKKEITNLAEDFVKAPNISLQQGSTPLVNKIFVQVFGQVYSSTQADLNSKCVPNEISIIAGNGGGDNLNQLLLPYGISIDDNQTVYIADCGNDRILSWKCNATNGEIITGGNGKGNRRDQLNGPSAVIVDKNNDSLIIADRENRRVVRWSRQKNAINQVIIPSIDCCGLTMDKDGHLYVCDTVNHEVQRWRYGDDCGTIVAGGNGKGNNLHQLNCPIYIFVDQDYSIYVSDSKNHRVIKWLKDAKEGIVIAGGNGKGNSFAQLSYPSGVTVDQLGQIYVADCGNNRVMRWCKEANEGTLIAGGKEEGKDSNQFSCPIDLSLDRLGTLYIVDRNNHRIQKIKIGLN